MGRRWERRKYRKRKAQEITSDDVKAWKQEGAVKKLIQALNSDNWAYEHEIPEAAKALAELGDERAVEPMIALLESGRLNGLSEGEAVLATAELAGTRAIPALIEELKSPNDHVQQCAATALHRLDSNETVKPLIETLQTADYLGSRRWAAQLLGDRGDQSAVEPLRAARDAEKNDDPGIRSVINISLEELAASE